MKQEQWSYKAAYDLALKELQDKAMQEFKQLKKSTNSIAKMQEKKGKDK